MDNSIFSYKTLCHAIAGSCGSVCAMSLALPLDTARTRLVLDDEKNAQSTIRTILELAEKEGILSLFRGGASTLQSIAISNFIYFYTFHGLKKITGVNGKQSAAKDLMFSCIAGVANVLMTNPIWVVNVHLKMQGVNESSNHNYNGILDGIFKIGKNEGLAKLWSGASSSLVLVSNPTIKFTAYEALKRLISDTENVSAFKAFLLGAMASSVATILTYPIQVVQTKSRFQTQKKNDKKKSPDGMFQMTLYLYETFGASIFFKGLEAKLLQTILTSGFMFLSYERILILTLKIMGIKEK